MRTIINVIKYALPKEKKLWNISSGKEKYTLLCTSCVCCWKRTMLIGPMHCSELHHCLGWSATGGDRHFTHPLKTCSLLVHTPGKKYSPEWKCLCLLRLNKERDDCLEETIPFRLFQMHFNNIKASVAELESGSWLTFYYKITHHLCSILCSSLHHSVQTQKQIQL